MGASRRRRDRVKPQDLAYGGGGGRRPAGHQSSEIERGRERQTERRGCRMQRMEGECTLGSDGVKKNGPSSGTFSFSQFL